MTRYRWVRAGKLRYFPRRSPVVVCLADGRVLIAGGQPYGTTPWPDEVWDPSTRRTSAAARRLLGEDGRLAGVRGKLFDPRGGTWKIVGRLRTGRAKPHTLALRKGLWVVRGHTFELNHVTDYDLMVVRTRGKRTKLRLPTSRQLPTLTRLADGNLLVTGGRIDYYNYFAGEEQGYVEFPDVDLLEVRSGTVRRLGRLLVPRSEQTAIELPDGSVLVVGGAAAQIEHGIPLRSGLAVTADHQDPVPALSSRARRPPARA